MRERFFGNVVPRSVRWFCPTYYVGAALGLIPVVILLATMAIAAVIVAFFVGARDAFCFVMGD